MKPGRKGGAGSTSSAPISTGFNGGGGSKERNSESSDITESEEEELPPIKEDNIIKESKVAIPKPDNYDMLAVNDQDIKAVETFEVCYTW